MIEYKILGHSKGFTEAATSFFNSGYELHHLQSFRVTFLMR